MDIFSAPTVFYTEILTGKESVVHNHTDLVYSYKVLESIIF